MARLLFDGIAVQGVEATAGTPLTSRAGLTGTVYLDEAATQLANIVDLDLASLSSTVLIDSLSQPEAFYGPADGTRRLWLLVDGGSVYPIDARVEDLITEVGADVTEVEGRVSEIEAQVPTYSHLAFGVEVVDGVPLTYFDDTDLPPEDERATLEVLDGALVFVREDGVTGTAVTAAGLADILAGYLSGPDGSVPNGYVPIVVDGAIVYGPNMVNESIANGLAYADAVPSLEELQEKVTLPASISVTTSVPMGATTFDERVGSVTLQFSGAVAQSDTDYWTATLVRYRGVLTPITLATQTTKVAGGKAVSAHLGWNLDNAQWQPGSRYLAKDDGLVLTLTKTGSPAALTDGVAAVRYEPNVAPAVRDTFNRADSTTTLGSTDTGDVWTVLPPRGANPQSVFGITSQQASVHVTTGSNRDYATIDAGAADYTVSARILDPSTASLAFRLSQDATTRYVSGFLHTATTLFRIDAGTLTQLGSGVLSINAGDEVAITAFGSLITVYVNGIQKLQVTDLNYLTSHLVGLRASSPALDTGLWADFQVAL